MQSTNRKSKIALEKITLRLGYFDSLHGEVRYSVEYARLAPKAIKQVIELVRSATHELAQHCSTVEAIGPMRDPDEAFARLKCVVELLCIDANRGRLPPEAVAVVEAISSRLVSTVCPILRSHHRAPPKGHA